MTRPPSGNNPSTGDYQGLDQLIDSEQGFKSYRIWIAKTLLGKYLKFTANLESPRILEFGAGTGNLTELMAKSYPADYSCLEIDSALAKLIKSKGFRTFGSMEEISEAGVKFDYIFSSNVLEHISNDVQALKEINNVMDPTNSILVLYVPAHSWLFSDLDRSVGHFRRYSKKELVKKVELSGFKVLEINYADSLGVFATLSIKVFGYKKSLGIGSRNTMVIYDKIFHPVSKVLDGIGFKKFLGCNLLLVAKRV